MSLEQTKYNFSRASTRDAQAFGSSRPGFPSKEVTREQVREWSAFMKKKGMKRVLSLLGDDEKDFYKDMNIDAVMAEEFGSENYARFSVFSPDALKVMSSAISSARETGDPIVIHCSGGEGRAGLGLGLWLVITYGLAPEDAAREVREETEKSPGIARNVNVAKLSYLAQNGTMEGFVK